MHAEIPHIPLNMCASPRGGNQRLWTHEFAAERCPEQELTDRRASLHACTAHPKSVDSASICLTPGTGGIHYPLRSNVIPCHKRHSIWNLSCQPSRVPSLSSRDRAATMLRDSSAWRSTSNAGAGVSPSSRATQSGSPLCGSVSSGASTVLARLIARTASDTRSAERGCPRTRSDVGRLVPWN
jgi:hypothetical protein